MLATVVGAVLLQAVLARYTVGGRWVFDLVLVGVVFVSLRAGATGGIAAGTIGGILQDMLSGTIIGVGGLTKTLVGAGAGAVGSQFVVVRAYARTLIVAGATVAHRVMVVMLTALVNQHWPGIPWADMLEETVINCVFAMVLFQATEALPKAVARRREGQRTQWGRRTW